MTQSERRLFLIKYLFEERKACRASLPPMNEAEQKRVLRSLLNIREPKEPNAEFLRVQDAYLQEEIREKGITDANTLEPVEDGIYLWQGDITTLKCGAIVNAANSRLLGCFAPCHLCIDNAIHTFAGVQLRLECDRIMTEQGHPEPTGKAKITKAYNPPSEYVLHTVGPIIGGKLTEKDEKELASCYTNCLALAAKKGIKSVAFCCISTGEFHFPNETAAHIAIKTIRNFLKANKDIKVIFNVFLQKDLDIYRRIFGING